MASESEEQNYSSPPKRIKLDESNLQYKSSVTISEVSFPSSFKTSETTSESNLKGSSGLLRKSMEESNSIFNVKDESQLPDDGGLEDDEDEDDDVSSTVSNLSDLSGLSDISGQDWKPMAGPMNWVQKQMMNGVNPRTLLLHLMGDSSHVPSDMNDLTLWKIIINMLSEPPRRTRLRHISTLTDVVSLLKSCSRIIVLTGAGVSVSCGIPDFRSRDGIYSRLAVDFPNLPDPQAMFDISYFRQDPRPFFKFAREIYPGQFKPSPCHRFIKMLERQKKLLRNYTQNIDTLEQVAGIENVIECHGSFATASCTICSYQVSCDDIRGDVFNQKIPYCPLCAANSGGMNGVMKPDIVFFGEGLPESFHAAMARDKDICDMLIVIGSSLKVRPVALIPSSIPNNVPQILINRERLPHLNFDVELLGDSDIIIDQLCRELGHEWTEVCWRSSSLLEANALLSPSSRSSYTNDYCEGNGEMSVDSGLGRHMSADSHMDQDMEEYSRNCCQDKEEIVVCSPGEHLESEDNLCGACRNKSTVKCQKIRRIHCRLKSPSIETTNGSPEAVTTDVEARMSMDQDDLDRCLVSRRHLSLDSTRDSGIGDGSNSSHSAERHMSVDSQADIPNSLASRLPDDSYFFIQPNRYIFPGAEVSDDAEEDDRSSEIDESETQDQENWLSQSKLS